MDEWEKSGPERKQSAPVEHIPDANQPDTGEASRPESPEMVERPTLEHVSDRAMLAEGPAPPLPLETGPLDNEGELEELVLPSSVALLEPLPAASTIGPDADVRIEQALAGRGRVNRYRATWLRAPDQPVEIEVREAPLDHSGLRREAEVLGDVQYAMLPRLVQEFEAGDRRYLALEWRDGPTLAEALQTGISLEQGLSIVVQLTQALRRLHHAGWALLGLAPDDVQVGQPVRILNFATAARIGEMPEQHWLIEGYSAPEIVYGEAISGKEDVYSLGALLFRVLTGSTVPEYGVASAELPSAVPVPGAPQLLEMALSPAHERTDLETFYRRLLQFKDRLGRSALGLQIASGTTIGLNPTRHANEDACGYAQWSIADDTGVRQRAVLCMIDGMGGMEAGDVASQAALRAVITAATTGSAAIAESRDADAPSRTGDAGDAGLDPVLLVQRAAEQVYDAAAGRAVGATITCATIDDGVLALAHVGDTRAYLLRDGNLQQITVDHSLVASMVASGMLTAEQARHHPESNKVLRSLGSQARLGEQYIDTLEATLGERTMQLQAGDQVLLVSDGVWGTVDDERLRLVLMEAMDSSTAVQVILRDALQAGAPDNASVIVARCSPLPST